MSIRRPLALASCAILIVSLWTPLPAASAGGMSVPSSGSIGNTGLFMACRSSSSTEGPVQYVDQSNLARTWDCGPGRRSHKGVDILGNATPGVTPVYAAAAGTVWTAERGNGFGWRVVLRHGHNIGGNGRWTYTIYGHMGNCATGASLIAPGIVPGASVAAGTLLGHQGDDSFPNGCASRTHLHWEVRVASSDVSNVFLATPASPNFYTGVALTADDPAPAPSVNAGAGQAPPAPSPTAAPPPGQNGPPEFTFPWPTFGDGRWLDLLRPQTPAPNPTSPPAATPTPPPAATPTPFPVPTPRPTAAPTQPPAATAPPATAPPPTAAPTASPAPAVTPHPTPAVSPPDRFTLDPSVRRSPRRP